MYFHLPCSRNGYFSYLSISCNWIQIYMRPPSYPPPPAFPPSTLSPHPLLPLPRLFRLFYGHTQTLSTSTVLILDPNTCTPKNRIIYSNFFSLTLTSIEIIIDFIQAPHTAQPWHSSFVYTNALAMFIYIQSSFYFACLISLNVPIGQLDMAIGKHFEYP